MDINELARSLKNVREGIEARTSEVIGLQAELIQNVQYARFLSCQDALSDLRRQEAVTKALLSEALLAAHVSTGEKKYPGIGDVAIRELVAYDPALAVLWAIGKNEPNLLRVDPKAFDPVAKALRPQFVTITEEPFARIASKIEIE